MRKGLVHIYFGDGKGKTSAAIGLCVRAVGAELKVLLVQFLKDNCSCEIEVLNNLSENLCLQKGFAVKKFFPFMNEAEKEKTIHKTKKLFDTAIKKACEEGFDVLVMDELLDTIDLEILKSCDVENFLKDKPKNLEVVITGHNKNQIFNEMADYVTEFKKHKHPFDKGEKARKGIEM